MNGVLSVLRRWCLVFVALAILGGCTIEEVPGGAGGTGGSGGAAQASHAKVTATIGAEGGTLTHPTGAQLVVPPGALASPVELSMEGLDAPTPFQLGALPVGQAFLLGPEGQQFQAPVQLVVPFDATNMPAGADTKNLRVYIAPQKSSDFVQLDTAADLEKGVLVATTTHFSWVAPGAPLSSNPVFILTKSPLAAGKVGQAYAQSFGATGGYVPYTWSVASGSLPQGLALSASGALTGTPAKEGTFTFSVQVSDASQQKVQKAFSLTIAAGATTNPVPIVTSVTPNSALAGSLATAIVVTGNSFVPGAVVEWDGTALATTYSSATKIGATIPQASLGTSAVGTHYVSVRNPAPGGGSSESVTFTVTAAQQNPVPTLTSIDPTNLDVGVGDTQITIYGTNFASGISSAVIDQQSLSTLVVSPTEILATIPAQFLGSAGTLNVGVFNAPPGGGYGNYVTLTVGTTNPKPTLTGLYPSGVAAGSGPAVVQLTGTGFVAGAEVFFGQTALVPTVDSSTNASVAVPANLLAAPAQVSVRIVNPAPGGGASNGMTFTITDALDGGADAGAGPTKLTYGLNGFPNYLVIDAGRLFFTAYSSSGGIEAVSTDGTTSSVLATAQSYPMGIAQDATNLYFALLGDGTVAKVAKTGGAPVTLATGLTNPWGVAAFAGDVYATGDAKIAKIPTGGGAPVMLGSSTAGNTAGVAVVDEGAPQPVVYYTLDLYTGNPPSGEIRRVLADGSGESVLASNVPAPGGIVVDGSTLYFASAANDVGYIYSLPTTGGTPTLLWSQSGLAARQLVVDATRIYWVNNSAAGSVMSIGKDGTGLVQLADSNLPIDLVVDGSYVYYTSQGDGLLRVAKPAPVQLGDGGVDAGNDASVEAGTDASDDASDEGSIEAGSDSGPTDAATEEAAPPAPSFVSASRTEALVGSGDLVVTMQVANATMSMVVAWSDMLVPTTWLDATHVSFVIPSSYLGFAQTQWIQLRDPATGVFTHLFDFDVVAAAAGKNVLPTVSNLSPTDLPRGTTAAQTLTIGGADFVQGAAVQVNGELQPAANVTFVDTSTITVAIPANSPYWLASGQVPVQVVNPEPGGGASAPFDITVTGQNPAADATSIYPATIGVGTAVDWGAQINVANVVPGAYINAAKGISTSNNLGPCPLNPKNYCTFTVPKWMFQSDGDIVISVVNPAPGGGSGQTQTIAVPQGSNPWPTMKSYQGPTALPIGSPDQSIVITGTGFIASTTVTTSTSVDCPVTSWSSTSIGATLPASLFATKGSFAVYAKNPAPGGGSAWANNVTVVQAPTLTSLVPTPDPIVHGQAAQLMLVGSGFFQGPTANVNGRDLATGSYMDGSFTVGLPADLFPAAGQYPVYVYVAGQNVSWARSATLTLDVQ